MLKTSWNQTINWTKTFGTSPVVPSKTTAAKNSWTVIATEAQVYKKQDTISDLATIRSWASKGATALQPDDNVSSLTNDAWYLTSSTWVTSVNGSTWAITWLQTTANLKTDLTDNSDSYYPSQKAVKTAVDAKQAKLVSWTNIKTINGNSILGSGNLAVSWLPTDEQNDRY